MAKTLPNAFAPMNPLAAIAEPDRVALIRRAFRLEYATVAEAAERAASRIAGGLLLALAAYVVVAAGWRLWTRSGQTFFWPGLLVTLLAMPVMYVLARRKLAVAAALGSRAMRADAMESLACGWLALVVVVGLLAQALTGAWWVDAATSLGIVWLLVREGREAWAGAACCHA